MEAGEPSPDGAQPGFHPRRHPPPRAFFSHAKRRVEVKPIPMDTLPSHIVASALHIARQHVRARCCPDPVECALDLHAWLRAACLDRHGWRAVVTDGRPAIMIRHRLVRLH
jgi:hypothetical protein